MKTVPTPDDVFAGIIARLKADPAFKAQIPGGAWFGRRPGNSKGFPYLVGTVEEREPDYRDSSGSYLQTFLVELTIWCQSADQAAAQTGPARAWLDGLLSWRPKDPASGVAVPNAVKALWVKPAGGSLKLNPDLRRGQDVLAAGKRIEVYVEGNTNGA